MFKIGLSLTGRAFLLYSCSRTKARDLIIPRLPMIKFVGSFYLYSLLNLEQLARLFNIKNKHLFMESKIKIEVDDNTQPIIQIDYIHSTDVRDKLVKRFLEGFAFDSCWARFQYTTNGKSEYGGTSRTAIIKPITPAELREQAKLMLAMAEHLESQSTQ